MWKNINIWLLLTMYQSTTVLLDDGDTVYVQGSLAVSSFNTSTLGATFTVTAPLHTVEKNANTRLERRTYLKTQAIGSHLKGLCEDLI